MFNRKIKEANPLSAVSSITSLQRDSGLAIDIFHKTRQKLLKINGKIQTEVESRMSEIEKLQADISTLNTQRNSNFIISNNIDKILNN